MRTARVLVRSAFLALISLVVLAGPAHADPAKPGDFRSTVTEINGPGADAVSVKVVGGDGFLSIKVKPGHDVVVNGYSGGPWLHIRPDGVVEENQLSPATYMNAKRYGAPVPGNVTADTEKGTPVYKQVATGGEYAWHDHRIHWMSPDSPPNATRGSVIPAYNPWKVDMTVDHQPTPTVVQGTLTWEKQESPIPWIALALIAGAITLVVGRGKSTFVAAIAVGIASIAALQTGITAYRSIPSAAGPNPLEIILPSFALAAAIVGLVLHRKPFGVIAILASLAALTGWAIMRIAALFHPILPTDLPFWFDRSATAIAVGCSVGAAILAVRSGALVLKLPDFDFDDEPPAGQDVGDGAMGERSDVS